MLACRQVAQSAKDTDMMLLTFTMVLGSAQPSPSVSTSSYAGFELWGFSLAGVLSLAVAVFVYLLRIEKAKSRETKQHYTTITQDREVEADSLQKLLDGAKQEKLSLEKTKGQLELQVERERRDAQEARMMNPSFKRLIYNIATIGASGSGKSALLNKLVDPAFMNIEGTRPSTREQLDRTVIVSLNVKKHLRTEHVLRFYEWGGEFLVDAQSEMQSMCRPDYRQDENGIVRLAGIQALVFVVDLACPSKPPDLANPQKHVFSRERIAKQVNGYFSFDAIKFLLNQRILPYLQMVILFVNKCDRLDGNNLSEIEEKVTTEYFNELIMGLRNHAPAVEVIVGSAYTEAGLHKLFATLTTHVLPKDAWDGSLRHPEEITAGVANTKEPGPVPPRAATTGHRPPRADEAA